MTNLLVTNLLYDDCSTYHWHDDDSTMHRLQPNRTLLLTVSRDDDSTT